MIEAIPKVVVSTTLSSVDSHNTTIIADKLAKEISQLKQQPGKAIVIFGSPRLTQTLAQLGLVDEYQLTVSPVLLGSGLPILCAADRQAVVTITVQPRLCFGRPGVALSSGAIIRWQVAEPKGEIPMHKVISADGTPIAYDRVGDGPALISILGATATGLAAQQGDADGDTPFTKLYL